jgi:hypothetical protein
MGRKQKAPTKAITARTAPSTKVTKTVGGKKGKKAPAKKKK